MTLITLFFKISSTSMTTWTDTQSICPLVWHFNFIQQFPLLLHFPPHIMICNRHLTPGFTCYICPIWPGLRFQGIESTFIVVYHQPSIHISCTGMHCSASRLVLGAASLSKLISLASQFQNGHLISRFGATTINIFYCHIILIMDSIKEEDLFLIVRQWFSYSCNLTHSVSKSEIYLSRPPGLLYSSLKVSKLVIILQLKSE